MGVMITKNIFLLLLATTTFTTQAMDVYDDDFCAELADFNKPELKTPIAQGPDGYTRSASAQIFKNPQEKLPTRPHSAVDKMLRSFSSLSVTEESLNPNSGRYSGATTSIKKREELLLQARAAINQNKDKKPSSPIQRKGKRPCSRIEEDSSDEKEDPQTPIMYNYGMITPGPYYNKKQTTKQSPKKRRSDSPTPSPLPVSHTPTPLDFEMAGIEEVTETDGSVVTITPGKGNLFTGLLTVLPAEEMDED